MDKWNVKLHFKNLTCTIKHNILLVLVFFPFIKVIVKKLPNKCQTIINCPPKLNGTKGIYLMLNHILC